MKRVIAMVGLALATMPVTALVLLPAPAAAAERSVRIVTGNRFEPRDKFIVAGDTVVWTYDDANGAPHTVTRESSPERFDSSPNNCPGVIDNDCLDSGNRTYSHRFNTPGDYPYVCRIHRDQGMTGTIHVAPRATVTPTPTPSPPSPSPSGSPTESGSPVPSGSPGESPSESASPDTTMTPSPGDSPAPTPGAGGGSDSGAKAALAVVALGALGGTGFWIYRRFLA